MKVNIKKISAFNSLHMKDEEFVAISGSQKTPAGELCWEDIVFGFGVNTAYYTVYNQKYQSVFDTSDYINL